MTKKADDTVDSHKGSLTLISLMSSVIGLMTNVGTDSIALGIGAAVFAFMLFFLLYVIVDTLDCIHKELKNR